MTIFTKQERDIILDALAFKARSREDILMSGPMYTEVANKVHEHSELVAAVKENVPEILQEQIGEQANG